MYVCMYVYMYASIYSVCMCKEPKSRLRADSSEAVVYMNVWAFMYVVRIPRIVVFLRNEGRLSRCFVFQGNTHVGCRSGKAGKYLEWCCLLPRS